MALMDEAQQQQAPQGQPPQGQPPQGQPSGQAASDEQAKYKRAVHDDPVQQAAIEGGEDVSAEVVAGRQAPTDTSEQDMYPWEKPASQEMQMEYENAVSAMSDILYENEKSYQNIMRMVEAEPGPVGLIKAASTLVTEIDKQIDIPEGVIPSLPAQAFDMLHELAVENNIMEQLSEEEEATAVAGAQEMILGAYGMDTEDFRNTTDGLTMKDVDTLTNLYNQSVKGNGFSKKSV